METIPNPNEAERRRFLKTFAGTCALAALGSKKASASQGSVSKGSVYGVLVDLTRCIHCRACSRACVEANELDPADDGTNISPEHIETPSWNKWSVVNTLKGKKDDGSDFSVSVKQQCMHCLEPACASVCPVGALSQTEKGPVIYREERCIGCRYCMVACPFDVPKFDWHSGIMPVIGKCQFCAQNRIFRGEPPACTASCPTGALKFGVRQTLLFEAKVRIKANPEKYVQHIYGENEIGGTSWLYLSSVPFEKIGFRENLPDSPLPSFTQEVISRLPVVIAVLAGLFGSVAVSLKHHHENEIADETAEKSP